VSYWRRFQGGCAALFAEKFTFRSYWRRFQGGCAALFAEKFTFPFCWQDHLRLAAASRPGGGKPQAFGTRPERQAFPQIERQAALLAEKFTFRSYWRRFQGGCAALFAEKFTFPFSWQDHLRLAAASRPGGGKPQAFGTRSERQAFPQIERQAAGVTDLP